MGQVDKQNPLPLYIQVREDLRERIHSGAMSPGSQLPSEEDLINQYGVSSMTIKHALRGLAEEGLILRIKRKGTFVRPRRIEPSEARQSTGLFSFIIPDIEDLYVSEIYRGVVDAAQSKGYRISILSSDREIEKEAENINHLGRGRQDGAIIFPNWGRANAEPIYELKKRRFPFVLVSRYFRDIQTDRVVVDNRAGAYQAVEHLINLGHRRIGCVAWVECTAVEDRLAGYHQALGHHQIPFSEELVTSPLQYCGGSGCIAMEPATGGYQEMMRLLQLKPRPTAVFVVSDRLAAGALRAINEVGLRVPDDVSVVGFDNLRYAADLDLTTVSQPAFEIGKRAVEILINKKAEGINDAGGTFQQIVLPVRLVVRGSSGAPQKEDCQQSDFPVPESVVE